MGHDIQENHKFAAGEEIDPFLFQSIGYEHSILLTTTGMGQRRDGMGVDW